MDKLNKVNNISSLVRNINSGRKLKNNTMKREFIFPLIIGLVLGGLLMIFWQFNARLNNTRAGLAQLEQATAQNTKTVADIVAFINQATAGQNAAGGTQGTPNPTPAQ